MSEANDNLESQLAKSTDAWERVKLLGETAFHSKDRDARQGLDACREAIELAKKAGVNRLALSHFSPDYKDDVVQNIIRAAKSAFPRAEPAEESQQGGSV